MGDADFIEVKGVTNCGESKASDITMANVSWHEEVIFSSYGEADNLNLRIHKAF